jgi:hypothetical protein
MLEQLQQTFLSVNFAELYLATLSFWEEVLCVLNQNLRAQRHILPLRAEYVAAGFVSKECLWLRSLLYELSISPSSPTLIREDNQVAIKMANNPTSYGRTKHIGIAHHVLREHAAKEKVRFEFVAGSSNVADIFTKHLCRVLFQKIRLSLLQELPD